MPLTEGSLVSIGVLLLVACLIAMITRRFGWPYAVGLAAAGILIAYLPNAPRFTGGLVGYLGYESVRYFEPTLKSRMNRASSTGFDGMSRPSAQREGFHTLR